jgi:Domain of Unknown Function (DUF748)
MRNPLERMPRMSARWRWPIIGFSIVIVLAIVGSFLVDEPLRRTAERKLNEQLTGYTVRIEKLRFNPVGLSVQLDEVVVVQEAHPDPPVLRIPRLQASVQWRELIRAKVVGDVQLDRPAVHFNRQQLEKEVKNDASAKERGWQDAVQAIYPLEINQLQVNDAVIAYIDSTQVRPLRLSDVDFTAGNIRNIKSREREYPSDIRLSARVFEAGQVVLTGNADFLAKPHLGIKANVELSGVELGYFKPILERHHLRVRQGVAEGKGSFELAPGMQVVDLRELAVTGADVDYVHTPAMAAKEKQTARKAHETTKDVSNRPGMLFRAANVRVNKSTFGLVNEGKDPKYRVFVADTNLTITNLTNHLSEGTAVAKLNAKFMGNGPMVVSANFRPEKKGPDFDVDVRIEETDMRTLDDLMQAHTDFDVTQGVFSFYSELAVKAGTVSGYVKPLFRDIQVKREDSSLSKKLKEKAVNIASKILKNKRRDEVATVTKVEGPIDDPKANTMQVVTKLFQNAFFEAILPGLETEARSSS